MPIEPYICTWGEKSFIFHFRDKKENAKKFWGGIFHFRLYKIKIIIFSLRRVVVPLPPNKKIVINLPRNYQKIPSKRKNILVQWLARTLVQTNRQTSSYLYYYKDLTFLNWFCWLFPRHCFVPSYNYWFGTHVLES